MVRSPELFVPRVGTISSAFCHGKLLAALRSHATSDASADRPLALLPLGLWSSIGASVEYRCNHREEPECSGYEECLSGD